MRRLFNSQILKRNVSEHLERGLTFREFPFINKACVFQIMDLQRLVTQSLRFFHVRAFEWARAIEIGIKGGGVQIRCFPILAYSGK